ncbi:CU044_2847 family protein [Streptomyces sp. NRRL B-1347]|uniref:CU044_2847 family protein n=1 Tax=Streptomyces sp. NRRL B-1347 TaxID=1476877 RepID=UPI00131CB225|nr:CU044_2847 family protein [Streptomyces sp. NRRL B-1347]
MAGEQRVVVDLGDAGTMVVVAETGGSTLVADRKVSGKFGEITSSIERVGQDVLKAARRAGPSKAVVELGFGLAVESGQLVALLGRGRGEATIKVTLEWDRDGQEAPDVSA